MSYTYDANGNIETITEAGKIIKYYYNELNELIREDNQVLDKTIAYSYDAGGNIESKSEYAYTIDATLSNPVNTISYTYDDANWKDKLTAYNGIPITYATDGKDIGNPLTYDGYTYTWEEGRQLKTISGNGLDISFKYNSEGIRTEKQVGNVVTKYHLVGDKVTFEDNGTDKIYYTYGSDGRLVSMNLNGVEYYYVRNAQGDIVGLLDESGTEMVSYVYDSWGKLVSTTGTLKDTVGAKNPYRYRGYRYDTETGLYYLKSRYYNSEWGRFLNADTTEILKKLGNTNDELTDVNLFAYGGNNPVMNVDPDGNFWFIPVLVATAPTWMPWAVGTALALGTAITLDAAGLNPIKYAKSKSKQKNDNRAIPGVDDIPNLKRGNTEVIKKGRQKDNFKSRNNKRRPTPRKKHTPGDDHKRSFE